MTTSTGGTPGTYYLGASVSLTSCLGPATEITVEVTTLDALVDEFGRPDFVKIDVEGFEDAVVNGLSAPIRALSLEYQTAAPEIAVRTVARLEQLGEYEFAIGADRLDWTDGATLAVELERLAARDSEISGDVYARHLPQPPV